MTELSIKATFAFYSFKVTNSGRMDRPNGHYEHNFQFSLAIDFLAHDRMIDWQHVDRIILSFLMPDTLHST